MTYNKTYTVAIIGAGPRGLSALESLYYSASNQNNDIELKTVLFEKTSQVGNGPVYHRKQPDTNWLNVSERGLTIPERRAITISSIGIPGFPSYHEWSGFDTKSDTGSEPDYFIQRSHLGSYLSQRFNSLAERLIEIGLLEIHNEHVLKLDYRETQFAIVTNEQTYTADEVVLTIGHQPTELDEQIKDWKEKVDEQNRVKLFTNPYPVSHICNKVQDNETIALRGFGLAMVDVARALTIGRGGSFQVQDVATRKMVYTANTNSRLQLLPFSLNGLPMTPKPLNLQIDAFFIPSDDELSTFRKSLEKALNKGSELATNSFLITAITPLIVKKFFKLGNTSQAHTLTEAEIGNVVETWLENGSSEHFLIISKSLPAYESMQAFVDMATGVGKISLDYCIGQVWRHCQPMMYKTLSFTDLDDEVIAEIIQLDERLKRYSYGPPVDSLTQMLALVDAGVMTFRFANDPKISFNEDGWKFTKNNHTLTADSMVDTVLDSPKLLKIKSPLVKSLLSDSLIEPIHGQLGIHTEKNALVILQEERDETPLAVLGRLAKGTIIGVDAILECFGERSELWAEGVVSRMSKCT